MTASDASARGAPDGDDSFFLAGNQIGCLLLHGLGAAAHDMRFVGERLQAHGWTVSAIRIAGHGASLADLERSTRCDWYASAVDGLMALQRSTASIVVIGQSMGALLALQLAAAQPQVTAVGLLAPALVLSPWWLQWIVPAMPLLSRLPRGSVARECDVADPVARAANPRRRMPIHAIHELLLLQRETRPLLARVRQPVLIAHSRQDHTCPLSNVDILRRHLRGPTEVVILDESYHVLSIDLEKERVAQALATFVERNVESGRARNLSDLAQGSDPTLS